ncbi:hypothetical protein GCM10027051_12420 [Niabella terrae]
MKLYNFLFIMIMGIMFSLSSCEKTDDTYKNYENELNVFDGNAYDYFQSQPPGSYDSLLLALDRCPDLKEFMSKNDVTVFALANRSFTLSFQNLNSARADSVPALPALNISTIDTSMLQRYLARYIVVDKYTTADISVSSDGIRVPSVLYDYDMHLQYVSTDASGFVGGGPKSLLFSDTNNSLDINNWIRVGTTTVDVLTSNAIINYLPANHIFGFGTDFIMNVNKD